MMRLVCMNNSGGLLVPSEAIKDVRRMNARHIFQWSLSFPKHLSTLADLMLCLFELTCCAEDVNDSGNP